MYRSRRWWARSRRIARPTQPLPDLCPTSRAAPLLALPDLPDHFGHLAYIGCATCLATISLYVSKEVGQVRQVGQRQSGRGVQLPDLTTDRSGRLGNWVGGGQAAASANLNGQAKRYSLASADTGLLARKFPLETGRELWFNRLSRGSVDRFTGETA